MDRDLSGLAGSPYSLPDSPADAKQISRLWEIEDKYKTKLDEVRGQLVSMGLRTEISDAQRSREIYESNAIEGLGPDLAKTHSLLHSDAAREVSAALDRGLFEISLVRDPDMIAVLGLHGAKILAEQLSTDVMHGRPLTQADLRSLHEIITSGESFAGRYKWWHIQISGSDHEPPLPTDTSASMTDLISWFNGSSKLPALVKSAAAHAWLTHIHPFEDGNGRLARILANMTLSRAGLPPAIIKHQAQRGAYLDALGHSDVAGDIFPLTGLFKDAVKRFLREVSRPSYLRRIFAEEMQHRGDSNYDWWSSEITAFANRLAGELRLQRLLIEDVGFPGPLDYRLLARLDSAGNTWFKRIKDERGAEVLLWFGFPSPQIRSRMETADYSPSLYFSVSAGAFALRPYRRASVYELLGIRELALVPGSPSVAYLLEDDTVLTGPLDQAAARIGTRIASAFARDLVPVKAFRRSEQSAR